MTLKFKSFGFEKSKFGKKIKGQGQRQPTITIEIEIEIETERLKRLHQLHNYNIQQRKHNHRRYGGMEVWRYGGMEVLALWI
jgi:hypothetical protein